MKVYIGSFFGEHLSISLVRIRILDWLKKSYFYKDDELPVYNFLQFYDRIPRYYIITLSCRISCWVDQVPWGRQERGFLW